MPIPFLLVAAGIGGGIATGIVTNKKINALYNEFQNNEVIQEFISDEKAKLEEKYDEGNINLFDYFEQKNYLSSNDYIYKLIHSSNDFSELAKRDNKTRGNIFYIILNGATLIAGLLSFVSMYTYCFSNSCTDEKKYKQIIKSAKKRFL